MKLVIENLQVVRAIVLLYDSSTKEWLEEKDISNMKCGRWFSYKRFESR